jgi:transcription-repair coupling factor (superfamily II helicase)
MSDVIEEAVDFAGQESNKELIKWVNSSEEGTLVAEGLCCSAKSLAMASAMKRGIHMVILNSREDAVYFASDLSTLLDSESVYFFPSSVNTALRNQHYDSSSQVQRTAAIKALSSYSDNSTNDKGRIILVGYPESFSEKVVNKKKLKSRILKISLGDALSHEFVKETLQLYSFRRVDFVQEPGEYALRGSIIDLFSFSDSKPYRLDFFGDQIESIKVFDIDTQRTLEEIKSVEIYPNIYEGTESEELTDIFSFSGNYSILWFCDYDFFAQKLEFLEYLTGHKKIFLSSVSSNISCDKKIVYKTVPQPVFNKNFELLAREIKERQNAGYKVYILSDNSHQIDRLRNIFSSFSEEKVIFLTKSISLHEGFIDHIAKLCVFSDHQIFERYHRVKPNRSVERSERLTINELNSYQIGDYIVHIDHGIGIFGGLVKTTINGKQQEAVKIMYKDGDVIFVSIHGLHRISKFKSADSQPPKIYKLGTSAWQKLKSQTKSKVKDIAKDLISLYAKRMESKGFAFSSDSYLQNELEASFHFEDTPDQIKATIAVKEDMEQPYPMDRLICGDVGFGKTEVAIRAAFKAVIDGKQVALLVPTTILALQHYKTFTARLKDFPCTIDYICRLRGLKEISEISKQIECGKVDIIIGTHRLLNNEIKFKDLGLLIIDEEQKFGVAAKERLRHMKTNVDTLTLTATPIPRTLQFSLLGARDLSIINTPPPNRLPVETEIISFDEDIIRDAIHYEVERGGQVFFVHNRVEDIKSVEEIVKRLCPNVKTCIGHGQMESTQLEKIILDFMEGDYDVLVCTTIIENGIDIPNANTIIINQAQNFGLSDLHQLRGRVGRSNRKAFCYLIVPPLTSLTEDARRRLKAIESFSELGSGFNIAMQDLDIRGAGNLLGGEQSGFISDIGFETYQKILAEAFNEIRQEEGMSLNEGEVRSKEEETYIADCVIDTDFEILIPDDYVNIVAEKIRLYKELDSLTEDAEIDKFLEEMKDRFGPVPSQVEQLTYTVRLRRIAVGLGFERITLKNGIMLAYFVSNQLSSYYQSNKFSKILSFLQTKSKRFKLKEQRDKLYITVENVKSMESAYKILLEMNNL